MADLSSAEQVVLYADYRWKYDDRGILTFYKKDENGKQVTVFIFPQVVTNSASPGHIIFNGHDFSRLPLSGPPTLTAMPDNNDTK